MKLERFAGWRAWRVCLFGWPGMRGPVRFHDNRNNSTTGYAWHLDIICWRISKLKPCTCHENL